MLDLLHHMEDLKSRAAAIGRHLAATIRGPVLWLTLCGGLLVAAIFFGTIMMAGEFRERALVNSERELENTVLLLARHFDQQFEDSNTIAADVISRLQISGFASEKDFRERIASLEAHEILRSKAGVLSYLGDISIFDSNGDMINWSRPLPAAGSQYLRAGLLQDLQIRSAIGIGADGAGSQLPHGQPAFHHCPPAERARTASFSA